VNPLSLPARFFILLKKSKFVTICKFRWIWYRLLAHKSKSWLKEFFETTKRCRFSGSAEAVATFQLFHFFQFRFVRIWWRRCAHEWCLSISNDCLPKRWHGHFLDSRANSSHHIQVIFWRNAASQELLNSLRNFITFFGRYKKQNSKQNVENHGKLNRRKTTAKV